MRRAGLDIEVIFRSDHEHSPYKVRDVDPPWPRDIERWLFDRESAGRDGKAMVPMLLIGNADRTQLLRLKHVTESPALRHFP